MIFSCILLAATIAIFTIYDKKLLNNNTRMVRHYSIVLIFAYISLMIIHNFRPQQLGPIFCSFIGKNTYLDFARVFNKQITDKYLQFYRLLNTIFLCGIFCPHDCQWMWIFNYYKVMQLSRLLYWIIFRRWH